MARDVALTGVERFFDNDEIIVSKTDLKGRITYANRTFIEISGYKEDELLGMPHSVIRHPSMPRCVFKLLWDTLALGEEIFAYVVNKCKNGDHYWVFAHVTPSFDRMGKVISYHSSRRVADSGIIDTVIAPLYKELLREEERHANRQDAIKASTQMLGDILKEKNIEYDEFIFSLTA